MARAVYAGRFVGWGGSGRALEERRPAGRCGHCREDLRKGSRRVGRPAEPRERIRADDFGSIEPGKRAALIAVGVPAGVDDVEEYLVGGIEPQAIRWLDG